MGSNEQKLTPGQTLEQELLRLEPEVRPRRLQALERHAKETGNLAFLRAIKQYRQMSREVRGKPDLQHPER